MPKSALKEVQSYGFSKAVIKKNKGGTLHQVCVRTFSKKQPAEAFKLQFVEKHGIKAYIQAGSGG